MKILAGMFGVLLVAVGIAEVMARSMNPQKSEQQGAPVLAQTAAEWSISKAYTMNNQVLPGGMIASSKASDDGEIGIVCARGLTQVYVDLPDRPEPEAGTATTSYTMSLDGGVAAVGHGRMESGVRLIIGSRSLAASMGHAKVMRIRYTPLESETMKNVDFDMRGLPAALVAMRQACGTIR